MCDIVGLFLKDKKLEPELGNMLTDILITITNRGPDSAGIAIYGNDADGNSKLTIQSDNPAKVFKGLKKAIKKNHRHQSLCDEKRHTRHFGNAD